MGGVNLDVVTFGEARRGEAMALLLAEPGVPLRRATTFRRQVAGAERNVAVGLARLGHRSGGSAGSAPTRSATRCSPPCAPRGSTCRGPSWTAPRRPVSSLEGGADVAR
jgi:hypothetical protein